MSSDETPSKRVKVDDPLELAPSLSSPEDNVPSQSGKVPRVITSVSQSAGKCPRTTRSGKRPFSTDSEYQEDALRTINFSDYSSSNSDSEPEMFRTSNNLVYEKNLEKVDNHKPSDVNTAATDSTIHSQAQTHVDVEQEDGTRPTFSIVQTKESEEKQRLESIYNDTIITPVPLDVYNRLRTLEDKVMELEEMHPAWCAVHFNQPDRQFPPPPPITYVTRNSWGGIMVPRTTFETQKSSSKTT
ncbi:hypothetical protein K7432_007454 [Basidiobolus ranarum]|uniref:Uncharacterized protein n=1 Tax=Basidiobolus ranarum TaxID=34480 RepID=A0ABR2W098_9FUNG